ncbi:MAG: extracellular solute-binding protein [Clostridia bacterium]|nr:extracellular solute-binding protein [Clostridia bacterium]
MKKIISAIVIACLILPVTVLSHGQRKTAGFEVPAEFDASKDYSIVFWAKNDTNRTQKEIYKKAIENFEALYPNIKVEMRSFTNYLDIYHEVLTNIGTQTTPNVCITYPDHIATYLTGNNVVAPLDGLISDAKYGLSGTELRFRSVGDGGIVERFLNECRFGGNCYAIPFMRSTEALYINVDMVEKLGYALPEKITWDFIWEVSEAAMEKDEDGNFKVNGDKIMIPFIYKSTDNMMITMMKQKGGEFSDGDGKIYLLEGSDGKPNEVTREILRDVYPHALTHAFSTFKISSYPGNYMNIGQCIFAVDSTAGATWIGSEAPNMEVKASEVKQFRTAVREVPQYDPDNPWMISQGPSICVFNKQNPQEVLASWLFAQYLLSDETQIAYAQTEGYIPVTNTAQKSPDYLDYLSRRGENNNLYYSVKIDASKLMLDNIDRTFVTAVFNGSPSLREAAGQLIENITSAGRIGKPLTDELLDAQFSSVRSLYHLDSIGHASGGRAELGEMPLFSKVLLVSVVSVWIVIAAAFIVGKIKKKKHDSAQ